MNALCKCIYETEQVLPSKMPIIATSYYWQTEEKRDKKEKLNFFYVIAIRFNTIRSVTNK